MLRTGGLSHRLSGYAAAPFKLRVSAAPLAQAHCPTLGVVVSCSTAALSPKQRLLPLLDDDEKCARLLELAEKDSQLAETLPRTSAEDSPEDDVSPPLTSRQLFLVALNNFIPFVGFGFFDNFLMIVAGNQLDTTLCVTLGYSTMVAAALGNTLSDTVGIGLGGVIEACAEKLGLPPHEATTQQQRTLPFKLANTGGSTIGIIVGCFLGMLPLYFEDGQGAELREEKKRQEEMSEMIEKQLCHAVSADRTSFFVVDPEKRVLIMQIAHDAAGHIEVPLDGQSFVAQCYRSGATLNVHHLPAEASKFAYLVDNMLCVPIRDGSGQVLGVVQMLNKKGGDRFTLQDEHTSRRFAVMLSYLLQKQGVQHVARLIEDEQHEQEIERLRHLTLDIFDYLSHRLHHTLHADRASFFLVEKKHGTLYTIVAENSEPIHVEKYQGMVGRVAETGELLNIQDAYECPFFSPEYDKASGYRTRSALVVPVKGSDGGVIGVLEALNKTEGSFTGQDEEVLSEFATQISLAVESGSTKFTTFAENFKRETE